MTPAARPPSQPRSCCVDGLLTVRCQRCCFCTRKCLSSSCRGCRRSVGRACTGACPLFPSGRAGRRVPVHGRRAPGVRGVAVRHRNAVVGGLAAACQGRRLRDFANRAVVVRQGNGGKDRIAMLPRTLETGYASSWATPGPATRMCSRLEGLEPIRRSIACCSPRICAWDPNDGFADAARGRNSRRLLGRKRTMNDG